MLFLNPIVGDRHSSLSGTMAHSFLGSLFQFLADKCPFVGLLIPLLWISGDVSSAFQSQSGQPYLHVVEAYMIYIP